MPPTPFSAQLVENIINNEGIRTNPLVVVEQIGFLVQTTDFSVLAIALKQLFSLAKDSLSYNKRLNSILNIIGPLITKFEQSYGFKSAIIEFYETQSEFPVDILSRLHISASFPLTIYCCSKFSEEASRFLVSTLIPKFLDTPKLIIPNSTFFQLISLNIKNIDLKPLYERIESPILLPNAKLSDNPPKFEDSNTKISLSSALNENDESLLKTPRKLKHLLSFYKDFNEHYVAIFLLSLVQPDNRYISYLEKLSSEERNKTLYEIKEVLNTFSYDIGRLIPSLDVPEFTALQPNSCSLLFQALNVIFDKRQIPTAPFTTNWQNKSLQFSIIHYISSNSIPGLEFPHSDRHFNPTLMKASENILSKCNSCWLSYDFCERAIALAENNMKKMNLMFESLCSTSPSLVLVVIGQAKAHGETVDAIAIRALDELVLMQDSSAIYSILWDIYTDFMTQTTLNYYHHNPTKIKEIEKTASGQFQKLLMNKDVTFATDLAFAASASKPLGNFIRDYTTRYGTSSLPFIIEVVKKRSTEPVSKAETYTSSALIDFFDYLHKTFESYTIEIKSIIRNGYDVFCYSRKINKQFIFKLKIPQSKLQEIKNRSSENFTKLLSNAISVESFAKEIEKSSTNDPTLFTCTMHYLIMELQFLDKHSQSNIEKLGHLIGLLMLSDCMNEIQKNTIFNFIKNAISEPEHSPKFILSCIILNNMIPKLSEYPTFVFGIIRDTPLRDKNSDLYEKLQKVDQTMSDPLAINHPKTLKIHPELIARFENPEPPLKEVAEKLSMIRKDPNLLIEAIRMCAINSNTNKYSFLAWYVTCIAMDHPQNVPVFAHACNLFSMFAKEVFMASAYQAIKIILSPLFDKPNGGMIRRRLVVLGKLIGSVTLAQKKPILSRFIDLKKTLLYAFSQGKLYGVVPFVVSIFSVADDFFKPPNPYTSSILQVFAAIYLTDCLKSSIKQQINIIFAKMGVNISLFAPTPHLFPEKIKDNFDFLMTPFSLLHFVANSEVERLAAFDENVFLSFVNSYIVIPDSPSLLKRPELRESIRLSIAKQSLLFIASECKSLSKTASATVIGLVTKDLSNSEYIKGIAKNLTKQICAGLTLFTASVHIPRSLFNIIRSLDGEATADWVEQVSTKNYDWISQLLRDVVKVKTWQIVEQKLKEIEENNQQKVTNSRSLRAPVSPHVLKIYSDIGDLQLSQQSFPQYEIQQAKEKFVSTNPEYDEYIKGFYSLVSFDCTSVQNSENNEKAIKERILACKDFSDEVPSVEKLRSSVKSFLFVLAKSPNHDIEVILCKCLERIVASVPFVLVQHIQKYVLEWMRISIRSSFAIGEFIKMGLIVPEELDALYADALNAEPFNANYACVIAQFLHYAICEKKIIKARSMISCLSIVTTITPSELDFPDSNQYVQIIETIQELFENIDTEEFPLNENTKLSIIPPQINVQNVDEIQEFKDLLASDELSDQEILQAAHKCAKRGEEMFNALFTLESETTVKQVLMCLHKNNEIIPHLSEAIKSLQNIVLQRGCIINQDFKVQTTAAIMLISYACNSTDNALTISSFLHIVRPIVCPSFTFSWISLVSNRNIIYYHIKDSEGWVAYAILYSDFVSCVAHIDTKCESFVTIYKALLRLTLVLTHDFPAFMYESAQLALTIAPTRLTQLRNIFFTLQQPSNQNVRLVIPKMPLPQSLSTALPLIMSSNPFNSAQLKVALAELNDNNTLASDALVNEILSQISNPKSIASYEETPSFAALKFSFSESNYKTAFLLANSLFDRIRQDNKESMVASKIITALILADVKCEDCTSSDVLLRVLAERASTPAPHPPALALLVREIFNNNSVWTLPCMKTSPQTISFFSSLKQMFLKK